MCDNAIQNVALWRSTSDRRTVLCELRGLVLYYCGTFQYAGLGPTGTSRSAKIPLDTQRGKRNQMKNRMGGNQMQMMKSNEISM